MTFRNHKTGRPQSRQRGYLLITLMLAFALMSIALLAVVPMLTQQIQRDREEELRRRGTTYMRAIQRYYRKFGRYPMRLEDLENTNNVRYLRKRYRDPMSRDPETGRDREFKILHLQDVLLNNGPALGAAAGAQPLSDLRSSLGQDGPLGAAQTSSVRGSSSLAKPQGASDGSQSQGTSDSQGGSDSQAAPDSQGASGSQGAGSNASNPDSNSGSGSGSSGIPILGTGSILGVASTSKAKTVREFNKKNHYNEWYFIYDPDMDRGGMLVGPWQPLTGNLVAGGGQVVPEGGQGLSQSGFGQSRTGLGTPQQTPPVQANPGENPPQN